MIKYGIRQYKLGGEYSVYMPFKDTVFLGIVFKRKWLRVDGGVAVYEDRVSTSMTFSVQEALEVIEKHKERESMTSNYVDWYIQDQ